MKTFEYDALIYSDEVRPITEEITLVPGSYTRGDALGLVDGKYGLIGEVGYDASTFNAVLCDDIEITEDKKVMAYINGQFQISKMRVKDGFDISTLKPYGRQLQIIIK